MYEKIRAVVNSTKCGRYFWRFLRFTGLAIKKVRNKNILIDLLLWPVFKVLEPAGVVKYTLKKDISIISFFNLLHNENIDYVILRFGKSPHLADGTNDDIDMLIADDYLNKILPYLKISNKPNELRFHIYSVYGQKSFSFLRMPYFPPHLALMLIENSHYYYNEAILANVRVPNDLPYINSLIYTFLFHKNDDFLESLDYQFENSVHYDDIKRLGLVSLLPEDTSIGGLLDYIKSIGWLPSLDLMVKYSNKLLYLTNYLYKLTENVPKYNNLRIFLLREVAIEKNFSSSIIQYITSKGYLILETFELNNFESDQLSNKTRGGNWDLSFDFSGGKPKLMVIAISPYEIEGYDVFTPDIQLSEFKNKLRRKYYFNVLHSSDNPVQSYFYINYLDEIRNSSIMDKFKAKYNIISNH
jgi:hypothetical protein